MEGGWKVEKEIIQIGNDETMTPSDTGQSRRKGQG